MSDGGRPRIRLSARLSDAGSDNLRTIMRTGLNQTEATEFALTIVADALRGAWEVGATDEGQMPEITSVNITPKAGLSDAV